MRRSEMSSSGKIVRHGRIKRIMKIPALALMILMPVISFAVFESITGCIGNITGKYIGLNLLFYYAVYLAVFAVFGGSRPAVPVTSLALLLVGAAEYFTEEFSGHPITVHSLFAINTLGEVIGSYSFVPTLPMLRGAAVLLTANVFIQLFYPFKRLTWRRYIARLSCCGLAAALMTASFFVYFIPHYSLTINKWDASETYDENGFMYATGLSLYYGSLRKPNGYSKEALNSIENAILEYRSEADKTGTGQQTPVNIILIMNESFSELRTVGDYDVNEEYFPFLNSLYEADRADRGYLYVPVFGSGTSSTEFEVLMGDAVGMLPFNVNPYTDFIRGTPGSLADTLKANGYRTLAMHPMPGENWNRNEAYRKMGFDEFLDLEYYQNSTCEYLRNFLSDRSDYQCILDQINGKQSPDEKLFVFNVTIQNHGGYEEQEKLEGMPDIRLTGALEGKYPMTDQYLSLLKASDDALQYFLGELEKSDQPTMVLLFGDHQPSVEDEFFDEIYGVPADEVSESEKLMWYRTPYFVWKNYEESGTQLPELSSVYLGNLLLKEAGIEGTLFNSFLEMLREYFPVIKNTVVVDRDGTLYSLADSMDPVLCPYSDIMKQYNLLLYDHLIGKDMDIFHVR